MEQHTKGPWTVMVHDDETTIESDYQTIATQVSNCDAPIIAAAPDLLAALESIESATTHYFRDFTHLHPDILRPLQSARAAIAKAKGQSC